jgi:hypothetical protein
MKTIITIALLFASISLHAQHNIVGISHKVKKVKAKTGYALFKWEEIIIQNKQIQKKINHTIRQATKNLQEGFEDWDEYEPECKVLFTKYGFISYFLTVYGNGNNAAHGWREFQTLNFSLSTGKQVNFRDFIKQEKQPELDSLIIQRLKIEIQGVTYNEEDWEPQLTNLNFIIKDKGINILFRGPNYSMSIIEILLDKKELSLYLKDKSLFK